MNSFEDNILRVLKGDTIVGAAFLVADRHVATCAHVVESAGVKVGGKISLRLSDGKDIDAVVVPEFWRDPNGEDVSILRLNKPIENIQPLTLGSASGTKGHNFSTFGFPKQGQELSGGGEVIGQATTNGIKLLQLRSPEVTPGFSGAPIFDETTKRVVGMVVAITPPDEYQRLGTTAFAIPSEIIQEICPELQISDLCPYRSLDVFNEEDAPFFFGRERVVYKMIDSLKREPRFLAVLGPSGSGKSSVVRAGLIPALKQGKVPGSDKWSVITIRPANQPFDQLDNAGLSKSQDGLENAIRSWLESHTDKTRVVLIIDQFEELLVATAEVIRQSFIAELAPLLNAPIAVTVILTLRDDFYSRFLQDIPAFTGWLERGLVNIPPTLDDDELRAIVVEPARRVGINFEEGLLELIISDATKADLTKEKARSTVLPLLEFALTQIWEHRKYGNLTHNAYHTIGGVTGGLTQWADQAYYALNSSEQKLAKNIFCGLVHIGDEKEQTPNTRRVIAISELQIRKPKRSFEAVIAKLIQARLLATQRDVKTGQESVEIIHDALLREWRLLNIWINELRNQEQYLPSAVGRLSSLYAFLSSRKGFLPMLITVLMLTGVGLLSPQSAFSFSPNLAANFSKTVRFLSILTISSVIASAMGHFFISQFAEIPGLNSLMRAGRGVGASVALLATVFVIRSTNWGDTGGLPYMSGTYFAGYLLACLVISVILTYIITTSMHQIGWVFRKSWNSYSFGFYGTYLTAVILLIWLIWLGPPPYMISP